MIKNLVISCYISSHKTDKQRAILINLIKLNTLLEDYVTLWEDNFASDKQVLEAYSTSMASYFVPHIIICYFKAEFRQRNYSKMKEN